MRLWVIRGDPAFSMLRPARDGQFPARGGAPVPEPWQEIEFVEQDGSEEAFVAVDCLTINTGADGFLVSPAGRAVLAPMFGEAGSFWPVRVLGQPYWWLNCMAVVDALDRAGTDADWSTVEGEWGSFSWISTTRRLVFQASRLRAAPALFRIPEFPQGVLFASDRLREAVAAHELTGFRFEAVWSSEDGGVLDPAGIGFGGLFGGDDPKPRREAARLALRRRAENRGN